MRFATFSVMLLYMTQLNIHMTPEFEKRLAQLMRLRGLKTKSEAVRVAVAEAVGRAIEDSEAADFGAWRGAALRAPLNPRPRFQSDDDLWR